jgi:hypothetical protein
MLRQESVRPTYWLLRTVRVNFRDSLSTERDRTDRDVRKLRFQGPDELSISGDLGA